MMTSETKNNNPLAGIIWEEKYRPSTVKDCILPKDAKSFFIGLVKKGELPNLMLTGPAGTGKTTLALALCNELDYEVLMINGSNEGRLIDTLRNKITSFATGMSLSGRKKCVLIDEADYLPSETIQPALRNFIQEFSKAGVKFIFTCNYPNKIIEPLKSRTAVIDFTIPSDELLQLMSEAAVRIKSILKQEEVEVADDTIVLKMVKKYFPDMRRLINELQYKSSNKKLEASALNGLVNNEFKKLVKFISTKDVISARQWIACQPSLSIEDIVNDLFSNINEICSSDTRPDFILTLADWQYKSSFMPNKEIALTAMLVELMLKTEVNELPANL